MNAVASPPSLERSHRRLVLRLLLVIVLAFGFGFALVPLYNAFCDATGFNGKTAGRTNIVAGGVPSSRIDTQRIVTVEFTGIVMPGLPWEIAPVTTRLDLHPGELHQALYRVRNRSDKPVIAQAVPSVSPELAAINFEKIQCFCFSQQTLAPGETKELPLTFVVKPEIDAGIRTITLSYAFFNTSGVQAQTVLEPADPVGSKTVMPGS